MTWRDDLLPALFRGVEFHYADLTLEGGRKLADHEFPLRDKPYFEDMGRAAHSLPVAGYIIGVDYGPARDSLIAALDAAGPGTFQHPFRGPIQVRVRRWRVRESKDEGGIAAFDIEFLEDGEQPSPTSSSSTSDAAVSSAKSAMSTLQQAFAAVYTVAGYPARLATAARGLVGQITEALSPLTSAVAVAESGAQTLLAGLEEMKLAVLEPISLGTSIVDFFQNFADDVSDFVPAFDDTTSSRGPASVADPSYGLTTAAGWGNNLNSVIGTVPVRAQQRDNQDALIALVQGCAACALVQVYASTEFANLDEAGAARDQAVELIDGLAVTAADRGDNASYMALMDLQQAVTADLTARGKQLPDVITVQFGATLPALAIAQTIYGDASRAGELIARNAAPHPLFMPLSIEALSR